MATVGERDRARGSEVSRPRSEARARQTAAKRRERPGPRRSEDAETVDEALEIEREQGRREGAGSRTQRPILTEGGGSPPPGPSTSSAPSIPAGTLPSITAPFLFETALIAVDEFVNQKRFPIPSRLLTAWGLFGLLGLARGPASRTATVFAWGLVVATFYATVPGQNKPAGLQTLNTVGDFIGGKYGAPAAANNLTPNADPNTSPGEASVGGAGATGPGSALPVGGVGRY